MDKDELLKIQEAYVVPTKQIPPPRGSRPMGGVVGRHARKMAAKRMLDQDQKGDMEDAIRAAAIAQKAEVDGKRRQIDVKELGRLAMETERKSES